MTRDRKAKRLTVQQVQNIRRSNLPEEQLAERLQVNVLAVRNARQGRTYRHVPQPTPQMTTNPETGNVIVHATSAGDSAPNPAGYAAVIQTPHSDPIIAQGRHTQATGNRMLLSALNHALNLVNAQEETKTSPIVIRTPLNYLTKAINQDWAKGWMERDWRRPNGQPVAHPDLWQQIIPALENHRAAAATIPADSQDPFLIICQSIATLEMDTAARTQTTTSSHSSMLHESREQAIDRILQTIFRHHAQWAEQGAITDRIAMLQREYSIIK